jgi:hypothetical protein
MKKIILACLVALVSSLAFAQTYVSPYVKKDGTFVEGHFKSAPNSTKTDNYSSQGNINPYTGKEGTADPYKPSQPSTSSTYGTHCGVNSSGNYVCK